MGYENEDNGKSNIILKAGSYFLVTHTIQEKISPFNLPIMHVYMRQIEIGFAKNVGLWLDDNLFKEVNNQKWLSLAKFNCFDKNIRIVQKSHSLTAAAWIQSKFFEVTLHTCNIFKVIQDKVRANETKIICDPNGTFDY